MRAVDRYITYYKEVGNRYVDEIVYDRVKKTLDLYRKIDAMILGSEDEQGRLFTDILLPDFIFELVASSIDNVKFEDKKTKGLSFVHLYSNLKGKRVDIVIDGKIKNYHTNIISYFDTKYYLQSSILVDYVIIEILKKQLDSIGYMDVSEG